MVYDYLIIGAGVVGVTLALEIKKRKPQKKILLIEKEKGAGFHSSGRNSGVLHAGFYYTADSLKARFTRDGNIQLRDYCKFKNLRLNPCGKLVVAKNEEELSVLNTLLERGKTNGVEVHEITVEEAKKIEPRVITHQKALYSPFTSVMDPQEVLQSFLKDAIAEGIFFLDDCAYLSRVNKTSIATTKGTFEADFIINAAGLYADRIAKDFGCCQNYKILPFKGLYLYASEKAPKFKCHIYPVPNLKNPFLGVHHTLTVEGESKIGPTAIPALWREQYSLTERFSPSEMLDIVSTEISLLFKAGFDFKGLAWGEFKKYYRPFLVQEAATMATQVDLTHYTKWGKPGIRAQLMDVKKRTLVLDFCFEKSDNTFHVLNAVSPAFTCSIPFSKFLCDQMGL